jgi:hypothetical protein
MTNPLVKQYGKENILHPTALVMSGVESDAYWDIAIGEGIDRLLVSYHYIQRKGKRFLRERLEKHPNVKIMIDSGAYTFHVKEEEYRQKPLEFWEKYLEKYTAFIRANKDIIFSCVELDIANIVGFEKVDYFREKYFEPLKEEGVLVCYVWHEYDGLKYWEEMCQKYDYVGFSLVNSKLTEPQIVRMVNQARRYNALVHGFAVTRTELMSKIPFFTGDSTTWLVGTQYGELNWFDGRKLKRIKKSQWKTVYKQKFIKIGANWKLAGEENPYELIRINLITFKMAENYIRKRVRGKMYWMKDAKAEGVKKPMALKLKRPKKKPVEQPEPETNEAIEATKELYEKATRNREVPVSDVPVSKHETFLALSEKKEEKVIKSVEELELPDIEWFDGDCEDYQTYAEGLNIDPNVDKEELIDLLYNFVIFITGDDELIREYTDEEIAQIAEFRTNKTFDDTEEAIDALKRFYTDCACGKRDDFAGGEELFSEEAPPRPLEREEYLEDEEYVLVDASEEEMQLALPEPKENGEMPEVDELDRELASKGLVAVRDESGRFLKGQKKVRKPKQLYSKHFPKLACNTCYKAGDCPEYKPDHACAFEKVFKKFKTRNMDDLVDAMHGMADLNLERMQRLMMFEVMDGGMADPTLTGMIDQNLNILMKMKQLQEARSNIVAQQRMIMNSDGSQETTTTINNPGGGILEKLFGGGNSSEEKRERKVVNEDEVIDVD